MKRYTYNYSKTRFNMKNLNINSFFALILLVSLLQITSATSIGPFEPSDTIELIQTCNNGSSMCDYCNISSLKYQNSSIIISNVVMTKRISDFNYTLTNESKKQLGIYIVNWKCGTATEVKEGYYSFEVTTTGNSDNKTLPTFLFIIGFILLIIGFIFKNEFFGLFSGMLITASGVYIMIYGFGFVADTWTRAIAGITLGIGLIVLFAAMFEILKGDDSGGLVNE